MSTEFTTAMTLELDLGFIREYIEYEFPKQALLAGLPSIFRAAEGPTCCNCNTPLDGRSFDSSFCSIQCFDAAMENAMAGEESDACDLHGYVFHDMCEECVRKARVAVGPRDDDADPADWWRCYRSWVNDDAIPF